MNVVHVTHEAVEKIGGIGTVIAGLMTADAYAENVSRTILLGPLFSTDQPINRRLGEDGQVFYSSLDEIRPAPWRDLFQPIEKLHEVGILYGKRKVHEPCTGKEVYAEVVLVNVYHSNPNRLNLFKGELYKKFNIASQPFENIWEFEEYIRLAEPGFAAVKALLEHEKDGETVIFAHEYMGMPTALKAILDGDPHTKTVFYAHEVASVRPVVEKLPGHDTMFYNVLKAAEKQNKYIEDLFPLATESYKHDLVKAARYCDCVFAVGDYVVEELKFLDPHFRTMEIDLVYNGIPSMKITPKQREESHTRMQQYAENLFGMRPNWIAAHVARPVLSKALWRDLHVLHEMEPMLAERGETAVYFMLGTLAGQRRIADVRHMESVYGWPVNHEHGYPDLCQGEDVLGDLFQDFNRNHRAVKVAFVNQWDWNHDVCGDRMPEDMTFADIRHGTDVEFGMSVYEPFGISQFEPLSFGALCVPSNVCGCMGFARQTDREISIADNIIEANYLGLAPEESLDVLKNIPASRRDEIEAIEAKRLAKEIFDRLPRYPSQIAKRIQTGYELAHRMSWENVMENYFLPGLGKSTERVLSK